MESITQNVTRIKNEIDLLGGNLIAVSKTFSIDAIKEAHDAGVVDFGENYVEEALEKIDALPHLKWHYVGKVQTNNINKMIDKFDLIQTVYKLKHFNKINENSSKIQNVLIQIKHTKDHRDNGVYEEDLKGLISEIKDLDKLNLKGLMYLPPPSLTNSELKKSFQWVRQVFNSCSVKSDKNDWDTISMGMSSDYRMALENGATHVRIGSALFGKRDLGGGE